MHKIANLIIFVLFTLSLSAQSDNPLYYNDLSENFLKDALLKQNTQKYQDELAQLDAGHLATNLNNDTKRIAFWVNIYNAYIQVLLQEDPQRFEQKRSFFGGKNIQMFGRMISLEKIEHHIIRRSQWKFGLGNFKLWFRPKYERLLRLEKREPRVHFALNCGAKSCPPTVVLNPATLESQLSDNTSQYLAETTIYDAEQNTVQLTPLFMWFRGDFGNKKGIRKMLSSEGLIPENSKPKIEKIEYDWTLDLDNWKRW